MRDQKRKRNLKKCPDEGTEKCVCGDSPSELEEKGIYCPFDPEE